jgi:polysaccharide export outer membrane protein
VPAQLPQTAASPAAPAMKKDSEPYRIGPGDVLDVRVFNKPQFSRESVRVTVRGTIRMPLLDKEIRAACRTEEELADELEKLYLEYLKTPQVDVFVKEFQSTPVAVIGAVQQPSRFQLQRRVRLLEMLSFVGGPNEKAGRTVQVIHTGPPALCDLPDNATEDDETKTVDVYKLSDMLGGKENSNPVVRPGDIINVAEADQVFVVGNVLRPAALVLREPITVTRAIAMAGGLMPDTRRDKVRVIRQAPGSTTKTEIMVDLKAIEKKQAQDVALEANDIVDVPTNETKRTIRTFFGSFVPSIGQLPVRVVP